MRASNVKPRNASALVVRIDTDLEEQLEHTIAYLKVKNPRILFILGESPGRVTQSAVVRAALRLGLNELTIRTR